MAGHARSSLWAVGVTALRPPLVCPLRRNAVQLDRALTGCRPLGPCLTAGDKDLRMGRA